MCTFWTWLISSCFLFKLRVTFLSLPLSDSNMRSESLGVSSTGPRSTSTLSTVTHSSIRRFTAENNTHIVPALKVLRNKKFGEFHIFNDITTKESSLAPIQ